MRYHIIEFLKAIGKAISELETCMLIIFKEMRKTESICRYPFL